MRKMRSAAAVLITLTAAAIIIFLLTALPRRLAFDGGQSYTFYVGDTSKNCRVVTCGADTASLTRLTLKGVCGESATYDTLDIDEFLNKVSGEILFTENLSDSVNYYCKADLPYTVTIGERQINLHICVKQEGVTVASPIIFGGY